MPIPLYRERYCALFGVAFEELWSSVPAPAVTVAPVSEKPFPVEHVPALVVPFRHEYVNGAYLKSVHEHIRSIVNLDNRFGGTDLFRLSTRFFRTLHSQLGAGAFDSRIESDLNAAAGELAEVVGWLAYDAEEHDLVRAMNQESLYYTRLAGDRSVELLTLQNASMHAATVGRPQEALTIARSVLAGSHDLSPRLRALFLIREARAVALGGDESALRLFSEARSLFYEGTLGTDPAWAWWIDERELAWQEAMALRDLGQNGKALERFARSAAAGPSTGVRSQYIHQSYLLRAQVEAGDWRAVGSTIQEVSPLIADVASTRTVVLLQSVVGQLEQHGGGVAPRVVRDDLDRLKSAIALAPV